MTVPAQRIAPLNDAPINPRGRYVLYWMTWARRGRYNYGLQHARDRALELNRPLMVLEALRCGYPHASDRLHTFILQGMADTAAAFRDAPLRLHQYVEPEPGAGKGLLAALAAHACCVVCDWFPAFFLPRMLAAGAARLPVRCEAVDSCGLLPLAAPGREFSRAYDFRRYLQRELPAHLTAPPEQEPLSGAGLPPPPRLPVGVASRWPAASAALLRAGPKALARLPIDHGVAPARLTGGERAARERLAGFVAGGLAAYARRANQPEAGATSGLSPYLHFGHISPFAVFDAVARAEGWAPHRLSDRADGRREGWWGMGESAEAFLDQLVTWRELGYGFCHHRPDDYDQYDALPAWALATLAAHAKDQRPRLYTPAQLTAGATEDPIWNAAQNQLREQGIMPGYLRMLWGKKILEWSPSPRKALALMLELNDRYALDGRDPNSISGVFWCLGRFDRAFGPERPVFGKVRYMSSASTRRKLRLNHYLARWAGR